MPYASEAQSRLIHAKAAEGVPWAVKFVRDAHGSRVPRAKKVAALVKKRRRGRKKRVSD